MTRTSGFGKPQPQRNISGRAETRARAAKQFEAMKADGTPEFEVYIRIMGKKSWYPVGAIAVKRTNQINRAIFDSEDQLLQGAFRLFPVLRKHQRQLEYGYRLKEFKDDPIQLAVAPQSGKGGGIQAVVSQMQSRISAVFQRQ